MSYLILCHDNVQGVALWWRSDRRGYTTDVSTAGRYSYDDAMSISRIRGTDYPVAEEEIARILRVRTIVTTEDAGNADVLRAIKQAHSEPERQS